MQSQLRAHHSFGSMMAGFAHEQSLIDDVKRLPGPCRVVPTPTADLVSLDRRARVVNTIAAGTLGNTCIYRITWHRIPWPGFARHAEPQRPLTPGAGGHGVALRPHAREYYLCGHQRRQRVGQRHLLLNR